MAAESIKSPRESILWGLLGSARPLVVPAVVQSEEDFDNLIRIESGGDPGSPEFEKIQSGEISV